MREVAVAFEFAQAAAPGRAKSRPRARALVASGQQIDLSDRKQLASFKRRASKNWWQERAWYYENEVPLIGFAHDYVRDSMSRVSLVPAIISDDPSAPPLPLDDDNAPPGLDPDLCRKILERLAPFSDFMGSTAQKLDVSGECHVALIPDSTELDGERCDVFSTDEFFSKGDEYYYREDSTDQNGTLLDPTAFVFRLWQPDGQYRMQPTSHMRRLIGIADTLLMLTQVIRGISRSRIAMAGRILAIADEFSLESATRDGQAPTEDAGDGAAREDPFIEDFMMAAEAAILDHESASAALPMIVRGPLALIKDGIQSHDLDRKFDDVLIKLRQEFREEIANGVNLPRELLLGIGATNHWNAEEIRNQTWQSHLEPRAMGITAAATTAFYRPQLIANDIDPEIVKRCVISYDPAWFIGAPDLADQADAAYDRYEISGDYYREVKRIPPDAAPDLNEVKTRLWIKQQERFTVRETGNVPPGTEEGSPVGGLEAPLDESTIKEQKVVAPTVTDTGAPVAPTAKEAKTVLASAGPASSLEKLGPKLVGIERDLRTRLHMIANQTVTAALERAGMKVRAKTRRGPMLAQLDDVRSIDIVATLGKATVRSLGLQEHELLAGALASLEGTYRIQVRRAQLAAARAAAQAADSSFDEDAFDEKMADHRDQGWTVLAAGLTALTSALLYDPHPSAPAVGEFDETSVVPVGLIRAALDVAGGADVGAPAGPQDVPTQVDPRSPDAPPPGGGATAGPDMLAQFKQELGIVSDVYTWVYGDAPRKEFPPHVDLDGVTFTAWDDDVLANGDSFPDSDYLSPGDHQGCSCDVSVSFAQADSGSDEEAA